MSRSRPFSYRDVLWILALLSAVVGMFSYQRHYMNYHAPLIEAGLAAANKDGPALLEQVSLPSGAAVFDPVQKKINSEGRGMWRSTSSSVTWTGEWDAPGTHATILEWYQERLLAMGWKPYVDRIPSKLRTRYFKDKWFLIITHSVTPTADRPPHARFTLELSWDYWYQLEKTSAEYAADHARQGQ